MKGGKGAEMNDDMQSMTSSERRGKIVTAASNGQLYKTKLV